MPLLNNFQLSILAGKVNVIFSETKGFLHPDRFHLHPSDRLTMAKANVKKPQQHKDFINTSMRGFTKPSSCCLNGKWIVIGSESQLIFGIVLGNRGRPSDSANLEKNFHIDRFALAHIRAAVINIQNFKGKYLLFSPTRRETMMRLAYAKRGFAHA
jgi:hypothetical protein